MLALFAKAPVAGLVKTRLCPPLRPDEAAELYAAMLLDILDQHASEARHELELWYAPEDARAWFESNAPRHYRLRAQQGQGLGPRMAALFRWHAGAGSPVVLRGTDSPTLPLERVNAAFDALARTDLVLCPDLDGGYNLIGLRRPCDALFEIPFSTGSVLEETLGRARALELRVELLPAHYDVDTAADLLRLRPDLDPRASPRTLRWFAARGRSG